MVQTGDYGEKLFSDDAPDAPEFRFPLPLPEEALYCYRFIKFSWISKAEGSFRAEFRVGIHNELSSFTDEEVVKWKNQFSDLTLFDWKYKNAAKIKEKCEENIDIVGGTVLSTHRLFCPHSGNRKKANYTSHTKNGKLRQPKCIGCDTARLILTLQCETTWMSRVWGKDVVKEYPLLVRLVWQHNHPVVLASALAKRKVLPETISKLEGLFYSGATARQAYYECQMQMKAHYDAMTLGGWGNGVNSLEICLADSSRCPSLRQVRYLEEKFELQEFGATNGDSMWEYVADYVDKYNEENEALGGRISLNLPVAGGELSDFNIAISTPLMTRIRKHFKSDCHNSFVDSSGSVDVNGLTVTFIMIATFIGALPIGVIVTAARTGYTYGKGFVAFRKLTENIDPDTSWKSTIGMTDDDDGLREGLKQALEDITLLLCIFHILQAVWRWVNSNESEIEKDHRTVIYNLFSACLYAKDFETHSRCKVDLYSSPHFNESCREYFDKKFKKVKFWALCYRKKLLTHGNDTNNYSEGGVR